VGSFSDSGDGQELRVSSPQGRSSSLGRTPSSKTAASMSSKLSMKKLQQALDEKTMEDESELKDRGQLCVLCGVFFLVLDDDSSVSEMELMKEKYTKLLLGKDMSGGGKGVCTAVAITNLYGIFVKADFWCRASAVR
jgi:hypothetical protein